LDTCFARVVTNYFAFYLADSFSADGAPPNELAVETREKNMQTEEIVLFRNLTIWHPGVIALSIICHLLISLVFYTGKLFSFSFLFF